jgi:hypothetical protein
MSETAKENGINQSTVSFRAMSFREILKMTQRKKIKENKTRRYIYKFGKVSYFAEKQIKQKINETP